MSRVGVAVTGYPGAGKSAAAEILEEHINGLVIETGDVVRQGAARHFEMPVEELSSDELGDYSTMRRETDGGDYVMQDVFANLERNQFFPYRPAIICGMRDSEVPTLCEEFFDVFRIVWIEAGFDVRLDRLQTRGRQDEASFTDDDLARRDAREDEWGTGDLYEQRDVVIENESSLLDLMKRLQAVKHIIE